MTISPTEVASNEGDIIDPITLQIAGNALASIADEMATTLFRTAHSTVVRDGMDFSAALTDKYGQTIAQAVTVPFHLGSIPVAMETLLDHYGEDMLPGDIFLLNDPFDGGIHLPDIFIAKPVYAETTLVGFSVTTAHHGDIGGRVAGSSACDNTEIFQEGLRLPWLRYYREDRRIPDIAKIIEANVRIPRTTMGDINAQVAAAIVGETGLRKLALAHGVRSLHAIMSSLIDYTERLVRSEIRGWPDGVAEFTDYLDSDGIETRPVPIHCRVEIEGDRVIADFSNSSPMVRGALNSTRSFIQAAVYQAVRCALTVDVPNTAGMFRPIEVVTKPGTVTHVVMPGASSMRGVTGFRAFDAVSGALAQLIPARIPAAGEGGNTLAILAGQRDGEQFIFYELVCGTWGGNSKHDGNDGISNPASTAANIPVEVAEREFPLIIDRYGLVQDSGGGGLHRGGLAIERSWRVLADDVTLTVRSDRQVQPPYGLAGGADGKPSINVVHRRGDETESHPPMFGTVLQREETYYHRIAGGGGWGDPLERLVENVSRDVLNDKVSVDAARETYGVVFHDDGAIDSEATKILRSRMAAEFDKD